MTNKASRKPNIIICGCCRNCATTLPLVLSELSKIKYLANRLGWIICENDSTDKTRQLLKDFKESQADVTLIYHDDLVGRMPLRTERLALMRNLYLDEIRQNNAQVWDVLIVADLDNVNTSPLPLEAMRESINMILENKYTALFANSQPTYYDIWALRHPEWCPTDCWREVRTSTDCDKNQAVEKFIKSRQRQIAPDGDLIEVDSAFGGIGIYSIKTALQSMYVGLDEQGQETCEHVAFNQRIKSLSNKPLAINTKLVNTSGLDHIARNTRFITFERNNKKIFLECTTDHKLDVHMAGNPLYDRRLPLLASQLNEDGQDSFIIDIGANIGDSALLVRLTGCRLPIIAIEASNLFHTIMARNIARHSDLFHPIQPIRAFVACGQENLPLIHHDGTAQLSATAAASASHSEVQDKSLRLIELDCQHVSLLKIDTDGFDAAIINTNSDFFEQHQPILWLEADCNSDKQFSDWEEAIKTLEKHYEYAIVFDNFGFAIGAGKLSDKKALILDLIHYAYRHKRLPHQHFGAPTFYYIDLCLFPEKKAKEYQHFTSCLPEVSPIQQIEAP